MSFLKKLAIAGAALMMVMPAVKAQSGGTFGEIHSTAVDSVVGKAGKVILLKEYMNFDYARLSRNGRFVFGATGDEASASSYIYEIATKKSMALENCVVSEVVDFENYVTTTSIVIDGKTITYDKQGLDCGTPTYASADLDVIAMGTYIDGLYVTVIFNKEGKIIDTMRHFETGMTAGYGSFLWDLSADGMIGTGKSSVRGAFSNNSPAFWDRSIDKTFSLADLIAGKDMGEMNSISQDGRLMAGSLNSATIWLEYDRDAHTYELYEIQPEPGYGMSVGSVINDNYRVIGFDQISSVDVYSRKPWIYFINQQDKSTGRKIFLDEYTLNLYGLSMPEEQPFFSIMSLHTSDTLLTGTTYEGGAWLPYVIILNKEQIHPMARSVSVRQLRNTQNVEIKWRAAMEGDYTAARYNIYCDSVLVTTVEASAAVGQNFEYVHVGATPGVRYYQIQTEYTDGKVSDFTEKMSILVIGAGECLPVRDIQATPVYNRTVNLLWGLPTSDMSKGAAPSKIKRGENSIMKMAASNTQATPKYKLEDGLDRISLFNTNIESASAAARVGNYLYVSDYRNNAFHIFNTLSGEKEATVNIQGLSFVYDIEYHDNVFYCVCDNNVVYEIRLDENDPLSLSYSNSFLVPDGVDMNHIAYVEGENSGNDMLMVGGYNSIYFYNLNPSGPEDTVSGFAGRFDMGSMVVSGSAYHDGRVYFASQTGGGNDPIVEVFDFKTGKRLFASNLADIYPDLVSVSSYPSYPITMAGLTVGSLEDGTVVLECMTQPLVTFNYVATVEIESSPEIAGYNVVRDGKIINETLLKSRHFSEDLLEPGKYLYAIEYVATNGCRKLSDTITPSQRVEVEIYPIGSCDAPRNIRAFESNKMTTLSWEMPEKADALIGFNVYRDGQKLLDKSVEFKFIDEEPGKGKHVYRVEGFYDNSCVASDSIEIDITFEGKPMPPAAVQVNYEKESGEGENAKFTHTTSWELPFFEEPMAMGYCNTAGMQGIGLEGSKTLYAVAAWYAPDGDMDLFDDLYLVGLEFAAGEVETLNAIVYIDDKMVYNQPITERRQPNQWMQSYLKTAFPMKQKQEIAVGYMIDLKSVGDNALGVDAGPAKSPGKSDLVSPDGTTFYSLKASGVDANLCINALVVRQRDLEQAAKTDDPQAYVESKVMRISSSAAALTPARSMENTGKSTSESYTLKGFNVYRDNQKLNEEPLTVMNFVEQGVIAGEYEYQVGAVYADGEEMSASLFISTSFVANRTDMEACPVAFYPNPVKDVLNIRGEYASLQLVDVSGRVVMDNVSNTQSLNLAKLQGGVYFINLVAVNGNQYTVKIVKK